MKKMLLIFQFATLMGCLYAVGQNKLTTKIQDGYYYGSDKLFNIAFLKMMKDTAIADFIVFQKFPRAVLTDTLLYNVANNIWLGRKSKLYQKKGKYHLATLTDSTTFGKSDIRIYLDEALYKKKINEYKSLAVWREYYENNLKKNRNKEEVTRQFTALEKKYNLNKLAKTLIHSEFLVEFEKFKLELNL